MPMNGWGRIAKIQISNDPQTSLAVAISWQYFAKLFLNVFNFAGTKFRDLFFLFLIFSREKLEQEKYKRM